VPTDTCLVLCPTTVSALTSSVDPSMEQVGGEYSGEV
jgi:hypothetical protein